MNMFQILGCAFCTCQLALHIRQWLRARGRHHQFFVLVWLAAFVLLAAPTLTSKLALRLGIGRGVDLVLYVLVLLFVWAHFHQYLRYKMLQNSLTSLVRELAVRDARRADFIESAAPRQ